MIISIQASHTTTTKMEKDGFGVLGRRLEEIIDATVACWEEVCNITSSSYDKIAR